MVNVYIMKGSEERGSWAEEEEGAEKREEAAGFHCRGRSQDGGGIGRGDHFLSYKFIERTIER